MDRSLWRIEVTPDDAGKETEFLHVLAPILVSRDDPKTAAELSLEDFPEVVQQEVTPTEVTFILKVGDATWEVTLNRVGEPGGKVRRRVEGKAAEEWELATEVRPVEADL